MKRRTGTAARIRAQAWGTIPEDRDFDAALERIRAAGNTVLQVDREARRVQLLDVTETAPVNEAPILVDLYCCDHCNKAYRTEAEALEHEATCEES